MDKSKVSGVLIILLLIPSSAYMVGATGGGGGGLVSVSGSAAAYRTLGYYEPSNTSLKDSDGDGILDLEDPMPGTYGTVGEEEYGTIVRLALVESNDVYYALNDLYKGYDSRELSKDEFLFALDKQEEIILGLIEKTDVIPPEKYTAVQEFYLASFFDLKNSVYYLSQYSETRSDRDLYLSRISSEIYVKNQQMARKTYD